MSRTPPVRALSVRQPFAELIMAGEKQFEYRTVRTNIRERDYIYASKTRTDAEVWAAVRGGISPDRRPVGHSRGHGMP